jgi:hypothetical protein
VAVDAPIITYPASYRGAIYDQVDHMRKSNLSKNTSPVRFKWHKGEKQDESNAARNARKTAERKQGKDKQEAKKKAKLEREAELKAQKDATEKELVALQKERDEKDGGVKSTPAAKRKRGSGAKEAVKGKKEAGGVKSETTIVVRLLK